MRTTLKRGESPGHLTLEARNETACFFGRLPREKEGRGRFKSWGGGEGYVKRLNLGRKKITQTELYFEQNVAESRCLEEEQEKIPAKMGESIDFQPYGIRTERGSTRVFSWKRGWH